jgi:hypothetical protein
VPLYRRDPVPDTPPDSVPRFRQSGGPVQAIEIASFRFALQFTDLASGQQETVEYAGWTGANWKQEADGTWSILEDYASVNLNSNEFVLGQHLYRTAFVPLSPRESDLGIYAGPVPTPEPGTIALAATGFLPVLRLLRRRRR